ncbi:hypothetical protein GCM10022631_42290 [Deinococcus rubellus]
MRRQMMQTAAALVLVSLSLTACSGSTPAPPPPDPTDTTPPSIVSVTPAGDASGVAKDTNIVVTFSEAMNQASAQAAFQSADLGASTISWDAAGQVMTVNPNADLAYTSTGKTYSFQITDTATDLKGNKLSNPSSTAFKTFRQLSATLALKASTVGEISNSTQVLSGYSDIFAGDFADNTSRRTFLGFDLSSLPMELDPNNILAARLRVYVNQIVGSPFTKLFPPQCSVSICLITGKSVVLEHMFYGNTLIASAYNANPLSNDSRGLTDESPCGGVLICIFKNTTLGWNASDLNSWLKDDLINRATRNNLLEVRVRFPIDTNADSKDDFIKFNNNDKKAQLVVTYLMP